MKRTALVLALAATLLFPITAYAGLLAIPIGSIRFPGLGETTASIDQGVVTLQTLNLRGLGVVACGDDPDCLATGLDGARVGINQNLRLQIDVESGTVSGSSSGVLLGHNGREMPFDANVEGGIECAPQPRACEEIDVRMRLGGTLSETGAEIGQVTFQYRGHLEFSPGDGVTWTRLRGKGTLIIQTP